MHSARAGKHSTHLKLLNRSELILDIQWAESFTQDVNNLQIRVQHCADAIPEDVANILRHSHQHRPFIMQRDEMASL